MPPSALSALAALLAAPPALSVVPYRTERDGGRIVAVLDGDAFDFHVDASPGYDSVAMANLLDSIYDMGYELLSEDECEAELLDNGATRIYLIPMVTT